MSGLMLVPTLASVAARLVGHEGFADLGFRRGRDVGRYLAVALLLPLVVGAIAYGAAWSTGLVRVRIPPLGLWAALMTAILLLNVLVATGEELGWRGYMLRQMDAAGVPHPVLTSSLVWGAWHVPLFLWGGLVHDGPPPVVITGLVMVTTTALGYLLGRITLDTLNVWRGGAARRLEHRHPGRVRPCCRG
jgi:membrane protease YdiL (CAAX protease family)